MKTSVVVGSGTSVGSGVAVVGFGVGAVIGLVFNASVDGGVGVSGGGCGVIACVGVSRVGIGVTEDGFDVQLSNIVNTKINATKKLHFIPVF